MAIKPHDIKTLELMQSLIDGYTFFPTEDSVFHKSVIVRKGSQLAVSTKLRTSDVRKSKFTPPSLLVTTGLNYFGSTAPLHNAREEISAVLDNMFNVLKDIEHDYVGSYVSHVLVHNVHVLYKNSVPEYVRLADYADITVPSKPAYKVLAFEVSLLCYYAENPEDFEIVYLDSGDSL